MENKLDVVTGTGLFANLLRIVVTGMAIFGFTNSKESYTIQTYSLLGFGDITLTGLLIGILSISLLILLSLKYIKKIKW